MPIAQTANIAMSCNRPRRGERVFEFLEEPEEVEESTRPVKLEKVEGRVTFDHVHFGYDPDKVIIRDFSADIQPGQKVAIVGRPARVRRPW